jgi:hypothetical protein
MNKYTTKRKYHKEQPSTPEFNRGDIIDEIVDKGRLLTLSKINPGRNIGVGEVATRITKHSEVSKSRSRFNISLLDRGKIIELESIRNAPIPTIVHEELTKEKADQISQDLNQEETDSEAFTICGVAGIWKQISDSEVKKVNQWDPINSTQHQTDIINQPPANNMNSGDDKHKSTETETSPVPDPSTLPDPTIEGLDVELEILAPPVFVT